MRGSLTGVFVDFNMQTPVDTQLFGIETKSKGGHQGPPFHDVATMCCRKKCREVGGEGRGGVGPRTGHRMVGRVASRQDRPWVLIAVR